MMPNEKLLATVARLSRLVERQGLQETQILEQAKQLIADLVAEDDWLPEDLAQPDPRHYRQYLLYGDPLDRFSLVSFVWGPGQETPIHDHTVWGVIGMLRGTEIEQSYRISEHGLEAVGLKKTLRPGEVTCISPTIGDIHRVSNLYDDQVSISIHLYGGNIGRIPRNVYEPTTGERKQFVSGYSNITTPNLWSA